MSTFSTYDSTVNSFYLAFYGRPADPAGLKFWSQHLAASNGELGAITQAFATSEEAQVRFGDESVNERISEIYQQLFNRTIDADGLAYWTGVVEQGNASLADVSMAILKGARDSDATLSAMRQKAADDFTAQVEASGSQYSGYASIEAARILVRAVTANATEADLAQLVKSAVSFADTATKTPAVVEAIAVNTTLLALFDTTRGKGDPVALAQALADTAKAAAGDPVTLESLLRGGGMDKVLKVMPAAASLKDVVKALADGGLPAAVEVVYPTAPVEPPTPRPPVQSLDIQLVELQQNPHDKDLNDGLTNVRYADVTFSYTGKNLGQSLAFEYRVDGGTWGSAGLMVNKDAGIVWIHGLDLGKTADDATPSNVTSKIELRGIVGEKTLAEFEYVVTYDGSKPTAGLEFDFIEDGKPGDATTTKENADVHFKLVGDLGDAIIEYRLKGGNGDWTELDPAFIREDGTFTIPDIDLSQSDPTIIVRLADAAGNVSEELERAIDGPFKLESQATTFRFAMTGNPSLVYLHTNPEEIVSVPGSENGGMADRSGLHFFDMRNGTEQATATDYLDGQMFNVYDGGGVRFDATLPVGLYKLKWEDGAFATATGTVNAGELIFAGGVQGNMTHEGFAINRIEKLTVDVDQPTTDRASIAYIHDGLEARSIVTGGGQDVIIDAGGDLEIGYRTFNAAARDLIIGFDAGHDKIVLQGDVAAAIDRIDDGDIAWQSSASANVKAVVNADTEAVSIVFTGYISTGNGDWNIDNTLKTLQDGIDVTNMAKDADLLILAKNAAGGALMHFKDLNGNGQIDKGETNFLAAFDNGAPLMGDVVIVGSVTPPDDSQPA